MSANHNQVFVKVNTECDQGIAQLVETLSKINGLVTLDSCEDGVWGAYVFFRRGDTWVHLGKFLQSLQDCLISQSLPCGYSLCMEWFGSDSSPRAQLKLAPEHVGIVAEAIGKVVPILNDRMTGLTYDK